MQSSLTMRNRPVKGVRPQYHTPQFRRIADRSIEESNVSSSQTCIDSGFMPRRGTFEATLLDSSFCNTTRQFSAAVPRDADTCLKRRLNQVSSEANDVGYLFEMRVRALRPPEFKRRYDWNSIKHSCFQCWFIIQVLLLARGNRDRRVNVGWDE